MLTKLAELAIRWPRRVLACSIVFFLGRGGFGLPVMTKLLAGGYDVPGTESARAEQILADEFDAGGFTLIFTVTDPAGADSDGPSPRSGHRGGTAVLAACQAHDSLLVGLAAARRRSGGARSEYRPRRRSNRR